MMARSKMAIRWASALFLIAGFSGDADAAADFDPLQYVDVLIGSTNAGNVFPGATLPYGMAKAVADTNSGSNQGGFTLDGSPVQGFSVSSFPAQLVTIPACNGRNKCAAY